MSPVSIAADFRESPKSPIVSTKLLVSAYSCCQPRRSLMLALAISAPRSAPKVVRSELVVCAATVRLSESAPVSVKPLAVEVEPCRRAKGVTESGAWNGRSNL